MASHLSPHEGPSSSPSKRLFRLAGLRCRLFCQASMAGASLRLTFTEFSFLGRVEPM